jgi:RNA polymerase sigma-70 factor (ECF subfamily)
MRENYLFVDWQRYIDRQSISGYGMQKRDAQVEGRNRMQKQSAETECKDQYRQSEGMSGMDRDFLLVQKMRMGDEKAIEIFVEKYYPRILSYCQVHIGDHGYAEDMTQETFERFFRSLKQYRHYGKAANYLYVIAANTCHDYHRKHKEIATETMPEQADTRADNAEERLDVQMAFKRLPEEVREVAVLYFLQEQKQKDIAVMLGIGLPLVKYRIRRARELLAGYLGDGG